MDVRTTGPLLRNRAGNARRTVNRIAKTAGCRHTTPHGLRRTFCTAGLVSGVPMRDIADRHVPRRPTHHRAVHTSHRVASFLGGMTG